MVTHTDREGTIRLIPARAASIVERAAYRAFERQGSLGGLSGPP